jgi:hypothetical protein
MGFDNLPMLAAEVARVIGPNLARIVAGLISYRFEWWWIDQYEMYISHTWDWCNICDTEVVSHNMIMQGGGNLRSVCDDCHNTVIWPSIIQRRGFFHWAANPNDNWAHCHARLWLKNRADKRNLNSRRRRRCRAAKLLELRPGAN